MSLKNLVLFVAIAFATNTMVAQEATSYELRVLTFEDNDFKGDGNSQSTGESNWSSMIDDPQYGGQLLYGSSGMGEDYPFYYWNDADNTFLANQISEGWGSYCFWVGGHAISNYGSANFEEHGGFNSQLTVYNKTAEGLSQSGMGHNGSDNFCVHYGYTDNSGFSGTSLPTLYFSDGEARVIDHMYVTNICYALNCYLNGNGLTAKITEEDWVKIVAIGYNASEEESGRVELYLVNGPDCIVTDWTLFDLSSLGAVLKVEFNITGSSDNGYGFSQPAYFAYDDVAVRFPVPTSVDNAVKSATIVPISYYSIDGQKVDENHKGLTIIRMSDGTVRKVMIE